MKAPVRIDLKREERLMVLDWGTEGVRLLPLTVVRRMCPCALCTDHRGKADLPEPGLHMMEGLEATATEVPESVRPIGRYAIQIRWQDGHDTGIYTFDYLRKLGELEGQPGEEA